MARKLSLEYAGAILFHSGRTVGLRRQFLYLNNFLPPEVLRVWEQELMHWFWRFVSNMKDSIAYFGFRQVLFKRGLDGANDSKHP